MKVSVVVNGGQRVDYRCRGLTEEEQCNGGPDGKILQVD